MTRRTRLTPAIRSSFCLDARRWLRHKTLGQAWRICPVGMWMAWWLMVYTPAKRSLKVRRCDNIGRLHKDSRLRRFYLKAGFPGVTYTGLYLEDAARKHPFKDSRQQKLATLLRAAFNSDGTSRKRRVVRNGR